jgi:hypothetical protein
MWNFANSNRGHGPAKTMCAVRRHRRRNQPRLEALELRTLLSVSPTGISFSTTEGILFNDAVATFSATDNGPFTATVEWGDGTSSSLAPATALSPSAAVTCMPTKVQIRSPSRWSTTRRAPRLLPPRERPRLAKVTR